MDHHIIQRRRKHGGVFLLFLNLTKDRGLLWEILTILSMKKNNWEVTGEVLQLQIISKNCFLNSMQWIWGTQGTSTHGPEVNGVKLQSKEG